jgi:RNA polymerase sigma-70 factor (ECF subfamily)
MPPLDVSGIERVFRDEHARAVAVLVRVFGDITIAEDAVRDAFAAAPCRATCDGPRSTGATIAAPARPLQYVARTPHVALST